MRIIRNPDLDESLWLVSFAGVEFLARSEQEAWDGAARRIAEWAAHWIEVGSRLDSDRWFEQALKSLFIRELAVPS